MKAIITLICLATSIFSMAQQKKTDIQKENLKGQVKSIKEIPYEAEKQDGKIIKTNYYNEYNVFKYDNNGNLIEKILHRDSITLSDKYIHQYDSKNNLTETIIIDNDGEKSKIIYKYNDKNYLIEEKLYSLDDDFSAYDYYKYDENGNKIEEISYINNKLSSKLVYSYNKENLIESICHYSRNGEKDMKTSYKYNDRNNLIKEYTYIFSINDDLEHTYHYKNYDEKGNWIERYKHFGNNSYSITERIIEYYE